jgi:hypothetical protein
MITREKLIRKLETVAEACEGPGSCENDGPECDPHPTEAGLARLCQPCRIRYVRAKAQQARRALVMAPRGQ